VATHNNNSKAWSANVIISVLASCIAALLIGLAAWTLHEVTDLEKTSSRLEADDDTMKLILTKMADRMNLNK
jgi:hypothetical protein